MMINIKRLIMAHYPAYVQRLLAQAREEGQWYAGQADAAALCFEVLALFPDHREAAELVYKLFCDEWLIYDNRTALQQQIEEWDDRPWQQRRRLALSFRFMSRWQDQAEELEPDNFIDEKSPADVAELLEQGRDYLLHTYCLGDDEGADLAWGCFTEAIQQTQNLQQTLRWVGKQYADLGLFADAAEILTDYCRRFDDESIRLLLAEVRWWRDNAHRIPWLPPAGDGTRYKRMMALIDPAAPGDDEVIHYFRSKADWPEQGAPELALDSQVLDFVNSAMSVLDEPSPSEKMIVDWSFLDTDDGQPGELPAWAKKMIERFPPEMAEDIARQHRWSRPIDPPATPPRHNPNEPPFVSPLHDEPDDWDDWFNESDV
jgi:hypothetical protein